MISVITLVATWTNGIQQDHVGVVGIDIVDVGDEALQLPMPFCAYKSVDRKMCGHLDICIGGERDY